MRLDPFDVPLAPDWLGRAHYMLKQYSKALSLLREGVSRAPNSLGGHVWLSATYAQLGKLEEARAEAAEVLRIGPQWTIEGTLARLITFKRTEDAEHLFDGLRKAGLPGRPLSGKWVHRAERPRRQRSAPAPRPAAAILPVSAHV
jgi:adenylate cyclase